jgi:GNAT superfamily N-acetyltransferase
MVDGPVILVGPTSGLDYRRIRPEWGDILEELEFSLFSTSNRDELCHAEQFVALAQEFPEGSFVGFDGDEAVAMGTGILKRFDGRPPPHTLLDVMPFGQSGHQPDGNWYYGITIAVRPSHRRRGIGAELYGLRKEVVRTQNLRGIAAGGVIPGFEQHKQHLGIEEYIDGIRRGEIYDATLSFQLHNGFEIVCPLPDYVRNPKIDNYAVLIVWDNPDYRPAG